jgi:hypothetical protein
MTFLYYWRDFAENTRAGPVLKMNHPNRRMKELAPGDHVWALARAGAGYYIIAAKFVVASAGINALDDPDRERGYGDYFFEADPDRTRYFPVKGQPNAERVIRDLSIRAEAEHLGQSFQGLAGFRELTEDDDRKISEHVAALR